MNPATDETARPPSPLEAAFNVARCHEEQGQVDKLGAPYLEHVRRVVDRVAAIAPDHLVESAKVAAALHDVVEDCDEITLEDLRAAGFSEAVVAAVGSVTRGEDEEYFDMVRRAAQDEIGHWVKLADNLDNSDPDRAGDLPEEVRERLRAKYAEARAILAAHGAVDPDT